MLDKGLNVKKGAATTNWIKGASGRDGAELC